MQNTHWNDSSTAYHAHLIVEEDKAEANVCYYLEPGGVSVVSKAQSQGQACF